MPTRVRRRRSARELMSKLRIALRISPRVTFSHSQTSVLSSDPAGKRQSRVWGSGVVAVVQGAFTPSLAQTASVATWAIRR